MLGPETLQEVSHRNVYDLGVSHERLDQMLVRIFAILVQYRSFLGAFHMGA